MRILITIILLLVAGEVVDTVWFDGYYTRALTNYVNDEAQQANDVGSLSMPIIQPPHLSHLWKRVP